MRCKHENADHERYLCGTSFTAMYDERLAQSCLTMERVVCVDCGHWLSLGESNDSPPEVQAEIRAAMLSNDDGRDWPEPTQGERDGYDWYREINAGHMPDPSGGEWARDCWIGYLSAMIDMHDTAHYTTHQNDAEAG